MLNFSETDEALKSKNVKGSKCC